MELKQMLFACQSIKEKLVVMLSGACGLRPNEMCRLKIADMNFDTGTMSVPTTKTESRWEIPISSDIIGAIKAYLQYERTKDNGYEELLLDQYGKPYNSENTRGIRAMIKRIGRKAELSKRIYQTVLRHSYATLLVFGKAFYWYNMANF
jgi:integrase